MAEGYSKTPLIRKLGIKPGHRVAIIGFPENYFVETLEPLPPEVELLESPEPGAMDFVHFFTDSKAALEENFPKLAQSLKAAGMLWISWPKKASKVPTDLDENVVRGIGLENGLVDVKVCAVDKVWSGLKFVYRLKDR